uniref:Reverse transcriptase domain-containing protein n=1 Tax=Photinus pyralis TaxID=7054 RepID=A0A1Y1JTI5_PHOPY
MIQSYLQNRQQIVIVNNVSSDALIVTRGVPQGSVLGPTLFLLYINDMIHHLTASKTILYADDTTILSKGKSEETMLQAMNSSLQCMENWLISNEIKLNKGKTQTIHFRTRLRDKPCLPCKKEVNDPVKFLGIYIDENLNWEKHILYTANKISKSIYLLRNLKQFVSMEVLWTCYHSLIVTHMSYGISVWGFSSSAKLIFKLQRLSVRIITGVRYTADVRHKFKENCILTLPCIYIYHTLLEVKNNVHVYT